MNIHIDKHTRLQSWNGQVVFGEFPLYIRAGNFTTTLMFHDTESIKRVKELLEHMLWEIENPHWPERIPKIDEALS